MDSLNVIPISRTSAAVILTCILACPFVARASVVRNVEGFPRGVIAAPDRSPMLLAQEETFRERILERERAKISEVKDQLVANPALVDDQNFLAQHPQLARYLEKHPEEKQQIKQDPKAFFANIENKVEKRMGD